MKKFFVIAAAALALVACNKEQKFDAEPKAEAIPVAFDSYLSRSVDTKAGAAGVMDLTLLKDGFGVFAYYTDGNDYDSNSTPNFMYNQLVENDGTNWTYAPVKYWPNEYGKNAIAEERDKVSFFAYAPYVKVTPSNGKIDDPDVTTTTWGITGLTRNTANGDPMVKYMVSFDPAKSVDLVWGVVAGTGDITWQTSCDLDDQTFKAGKPWLNVERPKTAAEQKLAFEFRHALSKLNVQIDADADVVAHAASTIDSKTKIYVRSITFTGFAMKGALNLNNTQDNTAYWKDYAGVDDLMTGEEVTIFDGRKDGKEGVADAVATNEKVLGLNPVIIQKETATDGVTNTPVNLFNDAVAKTPFFVIPTGDQVNVTIVYDVETEDANLPGYLSDGKTPGSSVQNSITKNAVFSQLENDKAYSLKIHLGMTSVKFDARVYDWQAENEAGTDLPANF